MLSGIPSLPAGNHLNCRGPNSSALFQFDFHARVNFDPSGFGTDRRRQCFQAEPLQGRGKSRKTRTCVGWSDSSVNVCHIRPIPKTAGLNARKARFEPKEKIILFASVRTCSVV